MSELFSEREKARSEEKDPQGAEGTLSAGDVLPTQGGGEPPKRPKLKFTKKTLAIGGAVLAAIVVAVVAFTSFGGSEFEEVRSKACQIAGRVAGNGDYFTIDTYPDEFDSMDEDVVARLLPNMQATALAAIKYANESLGFRGTLFSRMVQTTALMGRQSEETDKYIVSWTYHPNDGLEVTYEKK